MPSKSVTVLGKSFVSLRKAAEFFDVHYGNEPNDTLRKFKLGFGGINTVRSSYFYEL